MRKKLISIIIPAYKQEKTIKRDLQNINETLMEGLVDYDYEVICVVDGEKDRTFQEASTLKSKKIKVYGYKDNMGKGYAIRFGMVRSRGDLVSFLDAGMDISPKGIMVLMSHLEWYNADIIVGSKRHPASRVNYPLRRRIYSIGYHFMVRILFDLPLKDTQSGIKIFKREVLEKILPRLLVKKYAMDIEMLAVSWYLGFRRIYEAPIELTFDKTTSAIRWKTIFDMAWDTIAVFYRLKILRYYDDANRNNWLKDPDIDLTTNKLKTTR
ncbi:MAG: Dolichol-phosphate mannosyltransferase [Microgenomates group bacterium Gr01-1014_5]|nr:MAG: Dolichol-phosphate mannosyltransferase [Microgenomates group bacterium Gr01-1014_5]